MKKNTIITLLVLPLLTMMLIACSKHNAKDSTKKEEKKATMIAANQDKRVAFEKISIASRHENFKNGTSLEELKTLYGEPNKHDTKPAGDVTLDSYTWTFDQVTITASLYENSTIIKSIQNFIFNRDLKLGLKEYNKIKEGMTYNQVTKILTEPDDYTQAISTDKEQLQAVWISGLKTDSQGANISLIFEDGKLTKKSQNALLK
ncbi:DUF3862 domain-containing protein [Streptococcus iniae]|nr:DUF3862 domain-containing protein [Streptococcus iniae]